MPLPIVGENEIRDIVDFGIKYGVDSIALSFCETVKNVEKVKELLRIHKKLKSIKIIAKIESLEGVKNYE